MTRKITFNKLKKKKPCIVVRYIKILVISGHVFTVFSTASRVIWNQSICRDGFIA